MTDLVARSLIRRDGGTQPRAGLSEAVVADYAEAKQAGAIFPPLQLVFDGTDYWLWDGFHRDAADERIGLSESVCEVRAGTRRDAVLLAAGANASHGLRRTNDDKRRAALLLLGDAEWARWSDREIARRCAVSHDFVSRLRASLSSHDSERTFTTRHGGTATMDTAAIGRRAADVATLRAADPVALYQVLGEERARKQAAKRERRDEREAQLGERIASGNAALVAAGAAGLVYPVILADPEWRFEPRSRETGMDRAPENHYPTTPTAEIRKRPVAQIAARDAVLFLWATAPMLPDAFAVMADWGFTYRTHAIWVKRRPGNARGPGYWLTGEHEILMLGTRGTPPAPAQGAQWPSVFIAPVGPHSAKPERAYELIEAYFPSLPKIELNARARRPGWDVWGAEAPEAELPEPMGRPVAAELDRWAAEAAALFSAPAALKPTALEDWAGGVVDLPALPGLRTATNERGEPWIS